MTPNQFPFIPPSGNARIAIVGEAPGRDEEFYGIPFCGESGKLLDGSLGHVGIVRAQCFVGNVCQHKPSASSNDFGLLEWDGEQVQRGIEQLRADLEKFQPTIVLCLGNAALHLFKCGNVAPPRKGKDYDWPDKIGDWRGSLFESKWMPGLKCISTFHPAAVLRDYGLQGYYRTGVGGIGDMERLRRESEMKELELPRRDVDIARTWQEAALTMVACRESKKTFAIDIEGGPGNITSISFACSRNSAYVIPFAHADGSSVWTESEELVIWIAIKELLEDPAIAKLGQNFQYDTFALAWTYGIVVRNWRYDTMLSQWELFAELDKGLAVQTSLYTKQPFYKPDVEDGKLVFASDEEFWTYNGIDACVTFECWERAMELMGPGQRKHFEETNCKLLPAVLYMMLRGVRVDQERVRQAREKALEAAWKLQAEIDREAVRLGSGAVRGALGYVYAEELTEEMFAKLVTSSLCGKAPKRRVDYLQTRWQPMRWNGKKWVKDGKLIDNDEAVEKHSAGASLAIEPSDQSKLWLKPKHRTVPMRVPFTPSTLDECEDFILESKREAWREVKKIWKEIKEHEKPANNPSAIQSNASSNMGSLRGSVERHGHGAENGTLELSPGPSRSSSPQDSLLARLSTLLNLSINVGSTSSGGDAQEFLFETCKLPRIFKDAKSGRLSREHESAHKKRLAGEAVALPPGKRICTDQNAIDKLYAETEDVRVLWVLQLRRLRKEATDLAQELDKDGRLRASISLVKETGRMAESESPTGTGTNRQALNKDLRWIVVADEGCELGQQDLKGADSWTVAAECAALGDRTMLEDLEAGLKPAQIICLYTTDGTRVSGWSRTAIKEQIQLRIPTWPSWLYPASKSGCHGAAYGVGWKTLSDTVLKYSMADLPIELGDTKPVALSKDQAETILNANHARYPSLRKWHEKEAKNLLSKGWIETSVGHVRRFYGRKAEISKGRRVVNHNTHHEALAAKPQFYTTYLIKCALARLWYAPENRREDGSLVVEPLMCVHDSLVSQWRKEDREFARAKLREWFSNEVEIAGMKIKVPYDGTIGQDWGMGGAEKL